MKFEKCKKCFFEMNDRCTHKYGHNCGFPHNGRANLFLLKMSEFEKKYDDTDQKVVGKDGGLKNDKDKPDWSLLPLDVIEGIVVILTYGAKKYERDNWKTVENKRNFAALLRHLTKWQKGEDLDIESGLHHLDHALCDLMFMRWRIKNNKEVRL